jgi:hypothetical protein
VWVKSVDGGTNMDLAWIGVSIPLGDAVNFSGEKLMDYGTFLMDVVKVDFYSGCRPVNNSCQATGNLLCSARRQANYNFLVGGIMHTDTVGYFRLINKNGDSVFDGAIAMAGADLNMDTQFKAGDLISINSSKLSI